MRTGRWAPFYLAATAALGLASCSGGNRSLPTDQPAAQTQDVTASQAASPQAVLPAGAFGPGGLAPISTGPGWVDGKANRFRPHAGDTPNGGHGQTIDNIGCFPTMVQDEYHVHVFVGIVHNGRLLALPSQIGMVDPAAPVDGFTDDASCFYRLHTHDSSGIVHVELNRHAPYSAVLLRLKKFLNIWGIAHTADSFGRFQGPIHVYVGNVPLKTLVVDSYVPYTQDMDTIPLRSHEVIWIEIGATYYTADQLPPVRFYLEY